ncbi:MAG: dienelactone hydrolase family protein [Halodesulfurarchaeum sp.]
MRQETVLAPGARSVEATRDGPADAEAIVVACPPHPQYGGHRGDSRLTALSSDLVEEGVGCLRLDYGPWDEGRAEVEDVRNALRWAAERTDRVGLFGYSFGGAMAAFAASSTDVGLEGVSLLAPAAQVRSDVDVSEVVQDIEAPLQVIYGERDTTAEWEPFVEAARGRGDEVDREGQGRTQVDSVSGDHHFVGQVETVAGVASAFLLELLR